MLIVAAGWAKTPDQVREALAWLHVTHVVAGSFTTHAREGNAGITLSLQTDGTSANARGLPNPGIVAACRELRPVWNDRLVLSIAPASADDAFALMREASVLNARTIEINLSCPNRGGAPLSHYPEQVRAVVASVWSALVFLPKSERPALWWKVSPTTDAAVRVETVRMLEIRPAPEVHSDVRHAIVACNTLSAPTPRVGGDRVLDTAWCGLGGPQVYGLSLMNAAHYCDLADCLQVIGCGGVRDRVSRQCYLDVGCAGVQVGTEVHRVGGARAMQAVGSVR